NADLGLFGKSVRFAVGRFLAANAELNAPALRREIERLYKLNARVERNIKQTAQAARALACAIGTMPIGLRRWLTAHTPPAPQFPPPDDFLSPISQTCPAAVHQLRLVLSAGGAIGTGRKRQGGKRSRSFKPLLNIPTRIKRKRPKDEAGREFVMWLAIAYCEAIKKTPPRRVNEFSGPFVKFVCECFELTGAPAGNVYRLINELGKARRCIEKRDSKSP